MNTDENKMIFQIGGTDMVAIPAKEYQQLKERAELADIIMANKPMRQRPKMSNSDLFDFLCDYVCAAYCVTREEILVKGRKIEVVRPRQLIMYLGVKFGLTMGYLGTRLGGLNHSSVVSGNQKVKSDMKIYDNYRNDVHALEIGAWQKMTGKSDEVVGDVMESCGS